jgi:hypothetical protein
MFMGLSKGIVKEVKQAENVVVGVLKSRSFVKRATYP